MSATRPDGEKYELPPLTRLELTVEEIEYARRSPCRAKWLLQLHAHELLGWRLQDLGRALGHSASTAKRQVAQCRTELAELVGQRR